MHYIYGYGYSTFVPSRTANALLAETDAILSSADITHRVLTSGRVEIEFGRARAEFDVVALPHPSPADAERLARTSPGDSILVADRISKAAREILAAAGWGWIDRRGHVLLQAPGLYVERPIARPRARPESRVGRLFTPTGLDVALAMLARPGIPWGVHALAREVGRSPGRVSEILAAMRRDGLADRHGRGVHPDLFHAVAEEWRPRWHGLPSIPDEAVDVFGEDLLLAGSLAASELGAPLVVTADWPPELYVASASGLRLLLAGYGSAEAARPAAWIATAPSPYAHRLRSTDPGTLRWPLAHIVIAALDLSRDRSRGAETLENWDAGEARVW